MAGYQLLLGIAGAFSRRKQWQQKDVQMTSPKKGKHAPNCVQISYQLIRNTTSPDEKSIGVQSFVANAAASEILKVETKDNLRTYLGEYNPKKRNPVHEAI